MLKNKLFNNESKTYNQRNHKKNNLSISLSPGDGEDNKTKKGKNSRHGGIRTASFIQGIP